MVANLSRFRQVVVVSLSVFCLLGWLVGRATADIVHLVSGDRIEGEILSEDDHRIHIKTSIGVQSIAWDEVDRVERMSDPQQVYEQRARALAKDGSADGWCELGLWAADKNLPKLAEQAWRRALVFDPDHVRSRESLGYVLFRSRWVTVGEAKRAQGYVLVDGQWVSREDKERLDQGYVRIDGEWVHRDTLVQRERDKALARQKEIERKRRAKPAKVKPQGDGGRPGPVAPETDDQPQVQPLQPPSGGGPPPAHVLAMLVQQQKSQARLAEKRLGFTFEDVEEGPLLIHTTQAKDSERFRLFLRDLGKLYKAETKIYNLKFEEPLWPGKLQIYFFADKAQFDAFAIQVDNAPGAVQSGGYFLHGASSSGATLFHICMYNIDLGTLAHEMSHAFMARYNYSRRTVIPWVNEGVAEFLRVYVAKNLQLGKVSSRHRVATQQMLRRGDPRAGLVAMMGKQRIAGTEGWAYAVSQSLISFMVEVNKKQFVTFLQRMKATDGSFATDWTPLSVAEQTAAIEEAFGVKIDVFENRWRDYVLGN